MRAQPYRPNWFVALPIPATSWIDDIAATAPAEVKMFAPSDIHLTIAFLGAMPPVRKLDIIQHIDTMAFSPFSLSLSHLRPLPSERSPSALSFEVAQGHNTAAAFIAQWRDILCDAAGAPRDTRPPLPHVTVARPDRRHGATGKRVALSWAASTAAPEVELQVDSIALYTWSVDRHKRQFDIVYRRTVDL